MWRTTVLVRKISAGTVSTVAGVPYQYGSADGVGATFQTPTDVKVDATGNIFVADYYNNVIREVSTDGTVTTPAGVAT